MMSLCSTTLLQLTKGLISQTVLPFVLDLVKIIYRFTTTTMLPFLYARF